MANEGKSTREIARLAHVSLKDIGKIIRKISGDEDPNETRELKQARELKDKTVYAQCFHMFKEGKSLIDVVIVLDMESTTVKGYYSDYLELRNLNKLVNIYAELKGDFPLFVHLYNRIKKEKLTKQDITDILEQESKCKDVENRARLLNQHIGELQSQKLHLERELMEKQRFIESNLE